jgi:hypothetical protein
MNDQTNPSSLRGAYCLTGDRTTELVIAGVASACVARGDRWQPVAVADVRVDLMGTPGAVPWDEDAARTEYLGILRCVYRASSGGQLQHGRHSSTQVQPRQQDHTAKDSETHTLAEWLGLDANDFAATSDDEIESLLEDASREWLGEQVEHGWHPS